MTPQIAFAVLLLAVGGCAFTVWTGRRFGFLPQALTSFFLYWALAITFHIAAGGLSGDELTYHAEAQRLSAFLNGSTSEALTDPVGKRLYVVLLGTAYFLIAPSPWVGLAVFAPAVSSIPIVLGKATENFELERYSRVAAWLAVCSPPLVAWSPWLRREALSFLLLALVVLALSLLFAGRAAVSTAILIVSILTLSFTRSQLILVAVSSTLMFALLTAVRTIQTRVPLGSGLRALAGSSLVIVVGTSLLVANAHVIAPAVSNDIRTVIVESNASIDGTFSVDSPQRTSAVGTYGDGAAATQQSDLTPSETSGVGGPEGALEKRTVLHELISAALTVGPNLFSSTFGPFPWEWRSWLWAIPAVDGFLVALLLASACFGAYSRRAARLPALVLFAGVVPLLLGNAVLLANFGLVMRVRAHLVPFLLPIAAVGLSVAYVRFVQLLARHGHQRMPRSVRRR